MHQAQERCDEHACLRLGHNARASSLGMRRVQGSTEERDVSDRCGLQQKCSLPARAYREGLARFFGRLRGPNNDLSRAVCSAFWTHVDAALQLAEGRVSEDAEPSNLAASADPAISGIAANIGACRSEEH